MKRSLSFGALIATVLAIAALVVPAAAQSPDDQIRRGAYLLAAGGCVSCHTDFRAKGPLLAGGAAIKTPFGTFYGPNITPDRKYGIGTWSEADFIRAMRHGVAPDGSHYFPVFPYTSYTRMTDEDLKALKGYLFTVKPVSRPDRPHDIPFPFHLRFLQRFWKWLYFTPGPMKPDPAQSAAWNRGAYLVRALTHCGACHTPRDLLGGPDRDRELAGTADGPEGGLTPNITPDRETGIGAWSDEDLEYYLETGMNSDGDFAGSLMADVIEHSTGRLTAVDRNAIVTYLQSRKPIRNILKSSAKK